MGQMGEEGQMGGGGEEGRRLTLIYHHSGNAIQWKSHDYYYKQVFSYHIGTHRSHPGSLRTHHTPESGSHSRQ